MTPEEKEELTTALVLVLSGRQLEDIIPCVLDALGGHPWVHMFREAKGILEVGERLKREMLLARHNYFCESAALRMRRAMRVEPTSSPAKKHLVESACKRICATLDELWLAQEKYKAWAKTYGDI